MSDSVKVIDRDEVPELTATGKLFPFFEQIEENPRKALRIDLGNLGLSYPGFLYVLNKWNDKVGFKNRLNSKVMHARGERPIVYVFAENLPKSQ